MFVSCGYEGVDDVGAGFVLDGFASGGQAPAWPFVRLFDDPAVAFEYAVDSRCCW